MPPSATSIHLASFETRLKLGQGLVNAYQSSAMSLLKTVVHAIASAIVVFTLAGERSTAAFNFKLRFDSGFAA